MKILRRLWARLLGKQAPDSAPDDPRCIESEQFWALRKKFRETGVWENVIQDELLFGALPVYHYPKGTTVVVLDHGEPRIETLRECRLLVPMEPTRFEDEPAYLEKLRKALPDADEIRIVFGTPSVISRFVYTGDRGYWAVRLPKDVRPTPPRF